MLTSEEEDGTPEARPGASEKERGDPEGGPGRLVESYGMVVTDVPGVGATPRAPTFRAAW